MTGRESDEMTAAFLKATESCPELTEAMEIIKRNASGSICLIGGFVFRNIVKERDGVPFTKKVDLDFIVREPTQKLILPDGWNMTRNSFGNPKLKGPKYEIDFIPLSNIYSIKRRNLEPTVENFLSGVPLTVQAILYDVVESRVIGEVGIAAIETRTVGINNQTEVEHVAELRGKTVQKYTQEMADSLRFRAVL